MNLSDEIKVIKAGNEYPQVISAFDRIPYGLISEEIEQTYSDFLSEMTEICRYYNIYKNGAKFIPEGSNGDYIASDLKYKMSASLIDKEARFLFSETPSISVSPRDVNANISEDIAKNFNSINEMVNSVLESNNFGQSLLRAAKDCFIGKRVAVLVNFNEYDGVQVTFIPSTQFIYEYDISMRKLKKFVAFVMVREAVQLRARRIFKKKYELVNENGKDVVYVQEDLYDGSGALLENITSRQKILLERIPAVVILNDGLLGDVDGESEIANLESYESWYSKLANADIDAERKSMNSIKYTIDMDSGSTKGLSTAPGAYWDLGSDQSLDNPKTQIGELESNMNYSEPLKLSLDRIKTTGYEQVDMPNITLESMQGAITSGKALKAVYWPLIIRCKEKMKTWSPHLSEMISLIIDGANVYPGCMSRYISEVPQMMPYEVHIEQNTPLPEDETEEKSIDLSEVAAFTMSKKAYMQKWRNLTDNEVEAELKQIAYERSIIEDSSFMPNGSTITGQEFGLAQNQNGVIVSSGDNDTFEGNEDKSDDTTGSDSSRTLGDKNHV